MPFPIDSNRRRPVAPQPQTETPPKPSPADPKKAEQKKKEEYEYKPDYGHQTIRSRDAFVGGKVGGERWNRNNHDAPWERNVRDLLPGGRNSSAQGTEGNGPRAQGAKGEDRNVSAASQNERNRGVSVKYNGVRADVFNGGNKHEVALWEDKAEFGKKGDAYQGKHEVSVASAGVEYKGAVGLDPSRATAYVRGSAEARANLVSGEISRKSEYGIGSTARGLKGNVGVNAKVGGEVAFDPRKGQVAANVNGELFAGAKVGVEVEQTIGPLGAKGGLELSAGLGAELEADVGLKDGKLTAKFDVGATLAIGASVEVGFSVDVAMIGNGVVGGAKFVAGEATELAGNAKEFVGDARQVVTGVANNTQKAIARTYNDATQTATGLSHGVQRYATAQSKGAKKLATKVLRGTHQYATAKYNSAKQKLEGAARSTQQYVTTQYNRATNFVKGLFGW
jgi:hypothetical protein